ncbi:MAG: T9SS type A sorting domain-containing protein [Bacteroidetes bacterium]|nr:T9SS type A sorting domain-containing protein [Bacteroidota bacterium]
MDQIQLSEVLIGPNPNSEGIFYIKGLPVQTDISLFMASGQRISCTLQRTQLHTSLMLPVTKGVYYLVLRKMEKKTIKK